MVGKALLKKLIILRVLETYGESDKNTVCLPRHNSVKAWRASKIKGAEEKEGFSTPQVHQLSAVGKSCLRNEGKRPGRGLCCDALFFKKFNTDVAETENRYS